MKLGRVSNARNTIVGRLSEFTELSECRCSLSEQIEAGVLRTDLTTKSGFDESSLF
jgi:hypothetical protein